MGGNSTGEKRGGVLKSSKREGTKPAGAEGRPNEKTHGAQSGEKRKETRPNSKQEKEDR